MEIRRLRLSGTFEIVLKPNIDVRGHFMRTYDSSILGEYGLQREWVQENESHTLRRHTIRGLHFQAPPFAETKLVRVAAGAVLDVFVDLRRDSPTYGAWDSIELSADNYKMAYIPRGFAHGFCTLSDHVLMLYKVDSRYSPQHEGSLRWNDPALAIRWPTDQPLVSERDGRAADFASFTSPF